MTEPALPTEAEYLRHAEVALQRIDGILGDLDVDQVDCERSGDVLSLTFASGKRCIVNTQRTTREIWVAAGAQGWHFRFDGAAWVDARGGARDLWTTLAGIVHEHAGLRVEL